MLYKTWNRIIYRVLVRKWSVWFFSTCIYLFLKLSVGGLNVQKFKTVYTIKILGSKRIHRISKQANKKVWSDHFFKNPTQFRLLRRSAQSQCQHRRWKKILILTTNLK